MTQTVSLILSVLTALTQAALAFAVVLFVLDPKRAKALIGKYAFGRNAIRAAFVIALVAQPVHEAKVRDLWDAAGADQHVCALEVAVHVAL